MAVFVRIGVLVGVVVAQAVVGAGAAQAQKVSVQVAKGQLVVEAAAGQANQLVVAHSGDLLTVTDEFPLFAGPGCHPVTTTRVACGTDGVDTVVASLGDLADMFAYRGSLPTKVTAGTGNDLVYGGLGTDVINAGAGNDVVYGGAGDDELTGDLGADVLSGGPGADVLYGDRAIATSACGSLVQPGCVDELLGGDGDDRLYGGEWADVYRGGAGDDLLHDSTGGGNLFDGGPGDDTIDGASEVMRDVVDYSARRVGVVVDLAAGTGGEPGEYDTISGVQDIRGGGGDDLLVGNHRANHIVGNGGIDTIVGGGGGDHCVGEVLSGC